MSFTSYPISELLAQQETLLGKLATKTKMLESLNHTLSQLTEKSLLPHCRFGFFDTGILTIFAEDAAWATRLRYLTPTLLSQLRQTPTWAALRSIQVKVDIHWALSQNQKSVDQTKGEPIKLSPQSANQLQELANSLKNKVGMESIVKSLERLAQLS
jgi:hypothetical protein